MRKRQTIAFDVLVLGAGIVGVSTAWHLRRFGLDVALADRKHPGEEASFGNAGIVQRNGFVPHPVPTRPMELVRILSGQSTAVSYAPGHLLKQLPWIHKYHKASSGDAIERYARAVAPLRDLAVASHLDMARATNADRYYRGGGWLHLYRTENAYKNAEHERYFARVHGVDYIELAGADISVLEPGLKASSFKAMHWTESMSVSNPGAVVDAFWRGFIQDNGKYFRADALKLKPQRGGWHLDGERHSIFARHLVVALGAWSGDFVQKLGEKYPLGIKRGYHMHYRPLSGASLSRPIVDVENGFALTPTDNGIRLTTGVELNSRDAAPDPAVIKRVRRKANELLPLGRPLQDIVWMGSRPCLPDSLPVLGASPRTKNLWFNFGHGHDGFTLGPVCGRLLAEIMTEKTPCADPSALSPRRFF